MTACCRLMQCYTREAGVRNLEREIGNVCRKIARKIVVAQGDGEESKDDSLPKIAVDLAKVTELSGAGSDSAT